MATTYFPVREASESDHFEVSCTGLQTTHVETLPGFEQWDRIITDGNNDYALGIDEPNAFILHEIILLPESSAV
ncbi:hypothetical protein [Glacieibacterium sp.]|uniref:hypothetical protein n=1 Tax=Glacieibacterium sp. TaxID=2860237 RepID=UPI003B00B255